MTRALLGLENVSFSRSRHNIIDNMSFAVHAGECLAIVGPNGAGKSTLLNLMTGALQPRSGAVMFDGAPLTSWSRGELALRRAVLSQSTQLAFPYTVDETLRLSVPDKADKTDLNRHCQRAMDRMEIEGYGQRILQELSGGEQQRVQLARILVQLWTSGNGGTQALFLDEPVTGLDLKHQVHIMTLARSLVGPALSVIAVVHDMNLALNFASRVICLADGEIACDGPPREVLTPALLELAFGIPVGRFIDSQGRSVLGVLTGARS